VRERSDIRGSLDREAIGLAVGLMVVALIVTPRNASALTSLIALVVAPVLIAGLRVRPTSAPDTLAHWTLVVLGVSAAILAAACGTAADPRVSYFGMVGQHSGGLMWLAAVALMAAVVVFARPGDPGRIARAVGLTGAALAVSAMLDAAGMFRTARFSGAASGLLENSISLAQVLVVALGCAVAWALSTKGGRSRAVAWSCVALVTVGLALTSSRAAWVAVAVAFAFAARKRGAASWALAAACAGLVAVGLAGAWLVAGQAGARATDWLAALSNQRATIWTSAFAQARTHLLLGQGPEQFSAWAAWSSTPGVDLSKTGTYDPHNVALYWLLGAGIPGLAALLAATFAGTRAVFVTLVAREHHQGLTAMAAGVGGLGVALMFAWTSPMAALVAAVVVGALLGAAPRGPEAPAPMRRYALVVVVLFVAALAALAGPTSWRVARAEYAWARAVGEGTAYAAEAAALDTGDPTFAALAVKRRLDEAQAGPAEARAALRGTEGLERALERAAMWHIDAAFELRGLSVARSLLLEEKDWAGIEAALEMGKHADPASGLWDYVGAVEARSLDEPAAAAEHAEAALAYPQSEPVRAWLLGVSGGK
jgi:O-antigen ligase